MASVAVSEDDGVSPESVTRLAIGVSAGIPMSEGLGLHLGAGYSQKGFSASAFGADVTTEIDYLELTALAGLPLPLGERSSVHLLVGPALAFKLSCAVSASFMGESLSEDCGDDGPKSMDLGLTGGARPRDRNVRKDGRCPGCAIQLWAYEYGRQPRGAERSRAGF